MRPTTMALLAKTTCSIMTPITKTLCFNDEDGDSSANDDADERNDADDDADDDVAYGAAESGDNEDEEILVI